jgi:hypothetical protein
MVKKGVYANLMGSVLAKHLAELTQSSEKFQYVLWMVCYAVFSKKSTLVVLTNFLIIMAVLFMVSSSLSRQRVYQLMCLQYLNHEVPDLCVEVIYLSALSPSDKQTPLRGVGD